MIQSTSLLSQYVNRPIIKPQANSNGAIGQTQPDQSEKPNLLSLYMQNLAMNNKPVIMQSINKSEAVTSSEVPKKVIYRNNLRSMFRHNQVNMLAIIPRTFNAKDTNNNAYIDGNEQGGTFINAIDRLDEVKEDGFNTLHLLPISTPGKVKAMGTAGSVYSPKDLLEIDPKLYDPSAPGTVKDQFKKFIDECHLSLIHI